MSCNMLYIFCNCITYTVCLYSTLQMLTNIENRLEELFQQIELLPPDKVEAAEKVSELFVIPLMIAMVLVVQ